MKQHFSHAFNVERWFAAWFKYCSHFYLAFTYFIGNAYNLT
ncbi:hypothetical protein MS6194_00366 [Escherichia coli]|nr:hypothetical protein [Escherichia coli]